MALDFPNSPNIGDAFTGTNNIVWRWDGIKWTSIQIPTADGPFLPLAGGTVLGATTFSAPTSLIAGGTFNGTFDGTPTLSGTVTLSGLPLANTAAPGTSTTQLATTAFVTSAVAAAGSAAYLPLTGGTVSGPTTFSGAGTGLSVTNNASIGNTLITNRLRITGIPTSASGLTSGDVWSNGGVLMVLA